MGEGKGWISLYRKIQDSWLWQEKPFDKAHAWIDLLLSANHQDKKILFDSNLIAVERGQFITSIRKLCDKWGWSNSKVKRFLELLSDDKMIIYKSDAKKTTINIVNYELYQDMNITKNVTETSLKRHSSTTEASQKHTNNNDNNENNDNNDNKYSQNSNEFRLSQYLFNHIKDNNPSAKEPNFETWFKHFDYILRIDKRDIEEVKQVIKWCQHDSFWYKNILSPNKLREKYDTLVLQMNDPKKNISSKNKGKITNFADYPGQRHYDYDDLEKKLLGWDKE
ncbi:DNA replication protein DnaD [Clostridium acidisoli DSM 12555]|uniref:DNA replication protein DnaD n=1 Tax=Clostridium acidisoli DSM 12555 TaxID=1121291 RepID=A0A1W1X1M1_9CLOT|nr:hypothetical protein [Clostridium acidisoli]SMC17291.1 DNA replication protein DnaD [Clostridium acidisoli DSM 12555]